MTYRSLKNFINQNTNEHNAKIFDLISNDIKSKIILIVGNRASNVGAFLSSIMSSCEIEHARYINSDKIPLNKRFLVNQNQVDQETICSNAENILKISKKSLSNDDLLFSLATSFYDKEYIIIEMSETYYINAAKYISPFALVLCINDDAKSKFLIENAPQGTKEIITFSEKDNFDYISNQTNANGTRITFATKNKIIISDANLFGTSFYHYDYLYHISALDLNNVPLAHLAIESATVLFSAPRPYIYKGLENAVPLYDLKLFSLSPTVLLWDGDDDFILHHKVKSKIDEVKSKRST